MNVPPIDPPPRTVTFERRVDPTRLARRITKPDEITTQHRTGVVTAVNTDGTVDVDLAGEVIPDVPTLTAAQVGVPVQLMAWQGDMVALVGGGGGGGSREVSLVGAPVVSLHNTSNSNPISVDFPAGLAVDDDIYVAVGSANTMSGALAAPSVSGLSSFSLVLDESNSNGSVAIWRATVTSAGYTTSGAFQTSGSSRRKSAVAWGVRGGGTPTVTHAGPSGTQNDYVPPNNTTPGNLWLIGAYGDRGDFTFNLLTWPLTPSHYGIVRKAITTGSSSNADSWQIIASRTGPQAGQWFRNSSGVDIEFPAYSGFINTAGTDDAPGTWTMSIPAA